MARPRPHRTPPRPAHHRLTQLKARHAELTGLINAQPQPPAPDTLEYLASYLPQLLTTDGNTIERKTAIETLIHEVRLTDEGLIPVYQIPDPATPIPDTTQ